MSNEVFFLIGLLIFLAGMVAIAILELRHSRRRARRSAGS